MNKNVQSCIYCEEGEKLDSLMIKIIELPYSTVYLNRNQAHPGRCIVAYKAHKSEYFQLNPQENAVFFADVSLTAQALYNLFEPGKINYATFGDKMPHVHFHLVPKYVDGLQWGTPFQDEPKVYLTDVQYQETVLKIKDEIERYGRQTE
jgi:diadenosine tetraphosphate (Ap4A) HIT family hydrolase